MILTHKPARVYGFTSESEQSELQNAWGCVLLAFILHHARTFAQFTCHICVIFVFTVHQGFAERAAPRSAKALAFQAVFQILVN